jgi:hypothetical protein
MPEEAPLCGRMTDKEKRAYDKQRLGMLKRALERNREYAAQRGYPQHILIENERIKIEIDRLEARLGV